jgi:hypothetical protein
MLTECVYRAGDLRVASVNGKDFIWSSGVKNYGKSLFGQIGTYGKCTRLQGKPEAIGKIWIVYFIMSSTYTLWIPHSPLLPFFLLLVN